MPPSTRGRDAEAVYQQVVFLPAGVYHVGESVALPYGDTSSDRRDKYVWLFGAGADATVLRLKPAAEIGTFGDAASPRPVVQFTPYTRGREAQGNNNFQLFATDLAVVVPADQPHAVGISYGSANMGGVRNVRVEAEGEGGHAGLALVQYNNGPGWVEHVTVEGFDVGVEISDGWGEGFAFHDITVRNQNAGGVGVAIADKLIAIERLRSEQDEPDVVPVHLFDDTSYNGQFGGAPHLTLLESELVVSGTASVPAIRIDRGHSYLRDVRTTGYGDAALLDHGTRRTFDGGDAEGEYISVHGRTPNEADNVALVIGPAPAASLRLPSPATPEVEREAWDALARGQYTAVDATSLQDGRLDVPTPWVIVDPTRGADDTDLLQAALGSGARYVGLLNTEPFHVTRTVVVNGEGGERGVELIYGHMSEIHAAAALSQRPALDEPGGGVLLRVETGRAEQLTLKGLRFTAAGRMTSDFLLVQNDAAQTLVFEDVRCKDAPRAYRNGGESVGSRVFFENAEFAYNGVFNDVLMHFDRQRVWARQFNVEAPIKSDPVEVEGKVFSRYTTLPKVRNSGGALWTLSQKLGEHNGIFVQTDRGGETELLSVFFNSARTNGFPVEPEATNFLVADSGSAMSLVGQERIRTYFDERGNATQPLPHGNRFGVVKHGGTVEVIEGTALPTYLAYPGSDPFGDADLGLYDRKNRFRVVGLIRVAVPGVSE